MDITIAANSVTDDYGSVQTFAGIEVEEARIKKQVSVLRQQETVEMKRCA